MNKIDKVMFTGKTHTAASRRDGTSRGSHGALDIQRECTSRRIGERGELLHHLGECAARE